MTAARVEHRCGREALVRSRYERRGRKVFLVTVATCPHCADFQRVEGDNTGTFSAVRRPVAREVAW